MSEEVESKAHRSAAESGSLERNKSITRKGRGHSSSRFGKEVSTSGRRGAFETIDQTGLDVGGPAQSVEGWIIFVTGVHEEAQEDNILDIFCEFGDVKNIHVNLDRRLGYVKGYALVEYESRAEAQDAIDGANGQEILGKVIAVDWAVIVPDSR